MITTPRSSAGVLVMAVAVAVLALACSGSSGGPTAPVPTESEALRMSAASKEGDIGRAWPAFSVDAIALSDAQWIGAGQGRYVRVVVSFRNTDGGSPTTAVFRFFGSLTSQGALLSQGDDFFARVIEDGHDGRDWYIPAYRVIEMRMLDGAN